MEMRRERAEADREGRWAEVLGHGGNSNLPSGGFSLGFFSCFSLHI